jgi:aspartyl-tRNA(Asn)/glutamyl-tRNA(Gln) amidotransferase subunit A
MCVGSIGSDTGGSIRIPASFNGVAGLRPTIGRISNGGTLPVSTAFDTLGPMAAPRQRRRPDSSTPSPVMTKRTSYRSTNRCRTSCLGLRDPVRGMKIGLMRRWFFDGLHADVERAVDEAIATFRGLGVEDRRSRSRRRRKVAAAACIQHPGR